VFPCGSGRTGARAGWGGKGGGACVALLHTDCFGPVLGWPCFGVSEGKRGPRDKIEGMANRRVARHSERKGALRNLVRCWCTST
jgi:hypothetical protein